MHSNEHGFTLIIVLTILAVLSLVTLATFEQAQWVKRSAYFVWQQVSMQDKTWQTLILAENQLSKHLREQSCFVPYSVSNDYFFLHQKDKGGCTESSTGQDITRMYEALPEVSCARIQNQLTLNANFFRVTIHSEILSSKQRTILQSIFIVASQPKNKAFHLDKPIECLKNKQYQAGRQSWLLQ